MNIVLPIPLLFQREVREEHEVLTKINGTVFLRYLRFLVLKIWVAVCRGAPSRESCAHSFSGRLVEGILVASRPRRVLVATYRKVVASTERRMQVHGFHARMHTGRLSPVRGLHQDFPLITGRLPLVSDTWLNPC